MVYYPHPIIYPIEYYESTRMYATEDIAAMKVQAILGRGKKKNFWDMAELLKWYSLNEIISFHQKKYPSQQLLISIPQAVSFFEDANESEDPISLKGQTWESVKKIIQSHVNEYLK
jgi:predicted nucleotidyltransferase component of viral defense system